jgi:DNA polymerase
MTIGKERGRALELPGGGAAFITVHPSYLLRLPDAEKAVEEKARFIEDLKLANAVLAG